MWKTNLSSYNGIHATSRVIVFIRYQTPPAQATTIPLQPKGVRGKKLKDKTKNNFNVDFLGYYPTSKMLSEWKTHSYVDKNYIIYDNL